MSFAVTNTRTRMYSLRETEQEAREHAQAEANKWLTVHSVMNEETERVLAYFNPGR